VENQQPQPLPDAFFDRMDETPDEQFYATPRFVAHIEPSTIAAITALYRAVLPEGGAILDLMSSWISHLPEEMNFREVVGLGMNQRELVANPRLSEYAVQNLNVQPRLPFKDARFEAALCCVSIQYLTRPVEVLRDVARVCRPNAPLIITFSNRCFPSKAIVGWQANDDAGHAELVAHYLRETGEWVGIQKLDATPPRNPEPLIAVTALRR
jgi:SAM-dependent methyltransferase